MLLGQMKGTVHTLEEWATRRPLRRSPPFLIPVPLTETLPSWRDGEQAASAPTAKGSLWGFLFVTARPKAATRVLYLLQGVEELGAGLVYRGLNLH